MTVDEEVAELERRLESKHHALLIAVAQRDELRHSVSLLEQCWRDEAKEALARGDDSASARFLERADELHVYGGGQQIRCRIFLTWSGDASGVASSNTMPVTESGWHWSEFRKVVWEGSLREALLTAHEIRTSTHCMAAMIVLVKPTELARPELVINRTENAVFRLPNTHYPQPEEFKCPHCGGRILWVPQLGGTEIAEHLGKTCDGWSTSGGARRTASRSR